MANRTVAVELLARVGRYREGLRQAVQATNEFGRAVQSNSAASRQALGSIGPAALVAGGGIAAGLGFAVTAAMSFERVMSEVGAVSGATADQLADLREAAIAAGRDTAFSAAQAAAAEAELAKAGVSTANILGGGLRASLDLAAAGGLDVARAAEVASSAMTTFGLSGAEVGRVADSLAAGANKSIADVDQLAQALQQAGLVADQMGLGLEETVGTLALFSQNALQGSDAGTSLRTLLTRLAAPTDEARETMERLGISIYNAQGRMLPFAEVADELQDGLGGLTEAQRNQAAVTIAGQDAIRALNILMAEGGEGVREWTGAVSDAGFAADLADQKLDNLAGDLEEFRGSLETALIQGGSKATDVLRGLTQGATTLVNGFSAMPGTLQGVGLGLGGVSSAGLLALGTFGTLYPRIKQTQQALEGMGAGGAFLARNIGKATVALGAAGVALAAYSYVVGKHAQAEAEAKAHVDALTDAILAQGQAVGAESNRLSLEKILEGDLGAALSDADDLGVLTDSINHQRDSVESLNDAWDATPAGIENSRTTLGRLRYALDEAGLSSTQFGREFLALVESSGLHSDQVNELINRLVTESEAHNTAVTAARARADAEADAGGAAGTAAGQHDELIGALEGTSGAAEEAEKAIAAYQARLGQISDPFLSLVDAHDAYAEAQQGIVDAQRDADRAARDLADAQADVADALAITADRAAAAQQGIRDLADTERAQVDPLFAMINALAANEQAQADARRARTPREREAADLDVVRTAADVEQASIGLAGAIQTGTVGLDDANASLAEWVAQGLISSEQAARMAATFADVAATAVDLEGANVAAAASTAVAAAEQEAATERAERLADAQERVVEAQQRAVEAQQAMLDAQDEVTRSALDLHQAEIDLGVALATGATSVEDVNALLDTLADRGRISREAAAELNGELGVLADAFGVLDAAADVDLLLTTNVGDIIRNVEDLRTKLREIANEFGWTAVNIAPGAGVVQHATGGYAGHPGPAEYLAGGGPWLARGTDTIPAMLSPGEFVLREPAASALGSDALFALNRADRWGDAGWRGAGDTGPTIIQVPVPERRETLIHVDEVNAVADARQLVREMKTLERQASLTRSGG